MTNSEIRTTKNIKLKEEDKMMKLDFDKKFKVQENEDEINELGKNINSLSDRLKNTIKQLKKNNSELERDVEEKAKIDEMR